VPTTGHSLTSLSHTIIFGYCDDTYVRRTLLLVARTGRTYNHDHLRLYDCSATYLPFYRPTRHVVVVDAADWLEDRKGVRPARVTNLLTLFRFLLLLQFEDFYLL